MKLFEHKEINMSLLFMSAFTRAVIQKQDIFCLFDSRNHDEPGVS